MIDIAKECWTENPNDRLAIDVVCSRLATIKQGSTKTNLMDHLFERLEVHTADLEREVRERTSPFFLRFDKEVS
ncbi:unnamed protein product [Heligmosomoides polygyrus]|uniref:PK_Tyr_Ser-Thr domain-containing protein n=1 Tax=Heligmosomoides polygyrus TaxID=6339 RepID=A0A183GSM7_HELPZ|nr:unnamed protein product [Heligmosomoides polygyrus]